jgi:phenylalanyl-tRNA synthetase beta chain
MYLSLNWLKDFLVIPKGLKPEDVAQKLTMHTVEVEKIEKQSARFDKVVVGKVLDVSRHPNADRLNLTKVDIGEEEPLAIVCGAPNVAAGQLVAVALVGCELPGGMKIEEREVRGEKSCGMICAADELGLGDDHEGIMVLDDKKAKIGKPFAEYLGLEDIIFEVDNKSLTNRPDLWGHLGMAREMSVFLDSKLTKEFDRIWKNRLPEGEGEELDIKVDDEKLCPRYMAVKISSVAVKESPDDIKERLIAAGMRPINNIVDATNYVMLELGQPLHAFDAAVVEKIIVRRAKAGEVIKTLDGADRKLKDTMLVIADKNKALAIAGVMGGENSEISESTSSIILEAANFDASSVRKTSTELSLRSEASVRFEKVLDPNLPEVALPRFLEIIKKTCPEAKVEGQISDIKNYSDKKVSLSIDLDWVTKRVGQDLGKKNIVKVLESLGFAVKLGSGQLIEVQVPSFRATKDIKIREDVLEEIIRVHGYDNIRYEAPMVAMAAPELNRERLFERRVKNALAFGAQMTEVLNYSFLNEDKMAKLKMTAKGLVKLANPISNLHTHLRADLFPNMLDNVRLNQAKYEDISIFEIGSVFSDSIGDVKKTEKDGEYLPHQEKHLCLLQAGGSGRTAFDLLKGRFEYLMGCLDLPIRFEPVEGHVPEWVSGGAYAQVFSASVQLGYVGLVISGNGIKKETAILEISFAKLYSLVKSLPPKVYVKPNKYPALTRDLAFVVDSKALYNHIKDEIESFDHLISSVELFDVYEGSNLPKGMKSLAFHIDYESSDRTLEAAEVDAVQNRLIDHLEKRFEAKVRNF